MANLRPACVLLLFLPSLARADDLEGGVQAFDKRNYDLAIACFGACIRERPKDPRAYVGRGAAYCLTGKYDKAIEDLTEAIRLDPTPTERLLASAAGVWGAPWLKNQGPHPFFWRGVAYGASGEDDKAIADFTEAIRLDHKWVDAYMRRAAAYGDRGYYDKAVKDCTEVVRLAPEFGDGYRLRGYFYRAKREYKKAVKDYTDAIRVTFQQAPSDYDSLAWLLATCPEEGVRDGKRAVEYATKACELSEWKDPSHLEALAAAHAERGDFKQAIRWELKALLLGFTEKQKEARALKRLKLFVEGKSYRDEEGLERGRDARPKA